MQFRWAATAPTANDGTVSVLAAVTIGIANDTGGDAASADDAIDLGEHDGRGCEQERTQQYPRGGNGSLP